MNTKRVNCNFHFELLFIELILSFPFVACFSCREETFEMLSCNIKNFEEQKNSLILKLI